MSAVLCIVPAWAQGPQFEEFHTWTDVRTIKNFNERFSYDGDYGIRGLLTDRDWTLVYLRPSVRYRAKPWLMLHGGVGLHYNFFDGEDLPELRPWIGARFTSQFPSGWVVTNYLRLEYRAFYLKSERDWEGNFRGRWKLQATSPRFEIGSAREFYGLAFVETFFNSAHERFGERFRINLGMGKQVNDRLRADLNYLFHKVRLTDEGGTLEVDDHVLRLRFSYTFD